MTVQLELAVDADQFSVVAESVVPEAARPVGAFGVLVQPLAFVVTLMAGLGEDAPAESAAATAKL
jgi:hypothetical protein